MRYFGLMLIVALAALALSATAKTTPVASPLAPIYDEGGHFTARLNQGTRTWRLLPFDGQDLVIGNPDIYCRSNARVPEGLWVVAPVAGGGIELRATSGTIVPEGHNGLIALRACGESAATDSATLHAPQVLIDWLTAHSGAVFIDD